MEVLFFTVPRKSDYFQDDIFPDTTSYSQPSFTAEEWFEGAAKEPILVSLLPEGMKKQSEAPVTENKGPKYNFKDELEKGKPSQSSQQKVFEQFYAHISAAGESSDDDENSAPKKKYDDEDGW